MTLIAWSAGILLFSAGLAVVVARRQLLAMLLGLELMTIAANLILVHYACVFADAGGLAAALLVIAVAAAEAVVGISLILGAARSGRAPETGAFEGLKG